MLFQGLEVWARHTSSQALIRHALQQPANDVPLSASRSEVVSYLR
jgi:hypothetical protein